MVRSGLLETHSLYHPLDSPLRYWIKLHRQYIHEAKPNILVRRAILVKQIIDIEIPLLISNHQIFKEISPFPLKKGNPSRTTTLATKRRISQPGYKILLTEPKTDRTFYCNPIITFNRFNRFKINDFGRIIRRTFQAILSEVDLQTSVSLEA